MIVKFLGHGLNDNDKETVGNYICSSLNESYFEKITFFVAFLRKSGIKYLKPYIKKRIEEKKTITFYVGIDENVTSKEALEFLLELGVETYVYYSSQFIYHPKIYIFEGSRNRIILGSTNLTKAGMFLNVESAILLDFKNDNKSGLKVLSQLTNFYSSLIDKSDRNLKKVDLKLIEKLYSQGLISSEKFTSNENKNRISNFDFPKFGSKSIDEDKLGKLSISEFNTNAVYNSLLKITDEYLEEWDSFYQKLQIFSKYMTKFQLLVQYSDKRYTTRHVR